MAVTHYDVEVNSERHQSRDEGLRVLRVGGEESMSCGAVVGL